MHESDEDIVEKVLAGRTEFFAVLVQRYERPVYNLMFRYAGDVEEAADLTQDVFLAAFRRLDTFRFGNSLFSWLYAIAVNRARDWLRKNNRNRRSLHEYAHESWQEDDDRQNVFEAREDCSRVRRALDRLPLETREILILRYRHERTVAEVAGIFDISLSAAKMRLKRGLTALHKLLEQDDDDGQQKMAQR